MMMILVLWYVTKSEWTDMAEGVGVNNEDIEKLGYASVSINHKIE